MVKDQEIVARRGRENERKERSDIIVLQLILINKKKELARMKLLSIQDQDFSISCDLSVVSSD